MLSGCLGVLLHVFLLCPWRRILISMDCVFIYSVCILCTNSCTLQSKVQWFWHFLKKWRIPRLQIDAKFTYKTYLLNCFPFLSHFGCIWTPNFQKVVIIPHKSWVKTSGRGAKMQNLMLISNCWKSCKIKFTKKICNHNKNGNITYLNFFV